jgi:hypothetical protein
VWYEQQVKLMLNYKGNNRAQSDGTSLADQSNARFAVTLKTGL